MDNHIAQKSPIDLFSLTICIDRTEYFPKPHEKVNTQVFCDKSRLTLQGVILKYN